MNWIKQGLIFKPIQQLEWIKTHASIPFALKINEEEYRVYFSGRDDKNRSQIGFFEFNLNDPEKILNFSKEPILTYGPIGTFDDSGVSLSWITRHANKHYLYYTGWNLGVTVPFHNSVGLAISEDGGYTFKKFSQGPILDRSIYDPGFVASLCILIEKEKWRMWYLSCIEWERINGKPIHRYHIKYAESDDGILWQRNGVVCIDFKSEDEYAISRPCVIKENGLYKMWYSFRGESYRIGYAESIDGLDWERRDTEGGLNVSLDGGWDSEMVEYPFVFDHEGCRYMLYNGNGYGKTGIGLALLTN